MVKTIVLQDKPLSRTQSEEDTYNYRNVALLTKIYFINIFLIIKSVNWSFNMYYET